MFLDLIIAGLVALKEYIALHVLTCLIPAFLLAGGMVSFISKEAIIKRTLKGSDPFGKDSHLRGGIRSQ